MSILIKSPLPSTTPPVIATPQNWPTLVEMLIELAKAPGPAGPAGPPGVAGPQGPLGAPGPTSIAIGTTTTGAPGSSASVVNSGTPTALVLDFIIPEGEIGATGPAGSSLVTSVAGKTGAVALVKGDVGLGNVDNTADTAKPISTAQQAALDAKQATSAKGVANGYASLGADGKVPTAQLPAASTAAILFKATKGTPVANSGSGETSAWSFVIPANTFSADGVSLDLEIFYLLGSSTSSKTLRVKVGSSVIYGPAFGETNNTLVFLKLHVVRNGPTSFSVCYNLNVGMQYAETGGSTLAGQDFANAITINTTVQGSSSSQCTFQNGLAFIL